MGSLRDIRKRIGSVKSTRQITKAMKMVSAAKLKRATEAAISARPYGSKLSELVGQLAAQVEDISHPLLSEPDSSAPIRVVMISSDKGLCGSYNTNLFKKMDQTLADFAAGGHQVDLISLGKKGKAYTERRKMAGVEIHTDIPPKENEAFGQKLAEDGIEAFIKGEISALYVAYMEFESALTQTPKLQMVLPISLGSVGEDATEESDSDRMMDYIYEPAQAELLGMLLPRVVENQIYKGFLEAVASEHGSRMVAMDNASRNASELIDKLTLQYNRARQAAITTELVEIVSGAEAL